MTARPIRYQRQVSDRKGKIFYTSITSLSHISKVSGHQAAHGWRWCGADRHDPHPSALRSVRLIRQPRRSNHRGGCGKGTCPSQFTNDLRRKFKYGIYQSGSYGSPDACYRPRRRSCGVGCCQPHGRLRQRQPRR